ncbi:MAG: hypothetical protein HQM07_06935 [Zetaproteobacteria bacterium]|nr:hypothetical protein [Zetaproteobacteria bacterium]
MKRITIAMTAGLLFSAPAIASDHGESHATHGDKHGETHMAASHGDHAAGHEVVSDKVIMEQRKNLANNTKNKGFGPQSPRDIDATSGSDAIVFGQAPDYTRMNLCNIHFHKGAEHKGQNFSTYAGNGDGNGYNSGYFADTSGLSEKELKATHGKICDSSHSTLVPGDTIEVHYVHSTAAITPGATLGSCLAADVDNNPQLRVEAQVYVVVNDKHALDFNKITKVGKKDGKYQAVNMPTQDMGTPVNYIGSTTGPGYNEKGSPFQVSWSVFPNVAKVDINSVGKWCQSNEFKEDHAHGVRNLVKNPDLLSEID